MAIEQATLDRECNVASAKWNVGIVACNGKEKSTIAKRSLINSKRSELTLIAERKRNHQINIERKTTILLNAEKRNEAVCWIK